MTLTLAACADPPSTTSEEPGDPEGQQDPMAEFYNQDFEWEDCPDHDEEQLRCGTVTVPLDRDDPHGSTLEIALAARGDAENPHLLFNPGGPGASGVDSVIQDLPALATSDLLAGYSVVGFDPRGVHRSEGIECLSDQDYDNARLQSVDVELDDAAITDAAQSAEDVVDGCLERSGELLGEVDTFSAAADMDIIRAVLGEQQLHYVGFSYGTKLGLAYAEQFPQRVGRFVLDAVFDVSLSGEEVAVAQAAGFEDALQRFAQWCVDSQCPISGGPEDVVSAVDELFEDVAQNPRTGTDARMISVATLVNGFITPMYAPEGWLLLRDALEAALTADDFTAFQQWADLQAGRGSDGSYDWISTFAFQTITCLDYPMPSSQQQIQDHIEDMTGSAPTFGPYFGFDAFFCDALPHEPVGEPWQPREALPKMLLIGTTGDPATPVEWAENMHEAVPSSSLLVDEGEGHGAYRPGADCVTDAVDDYLLTGELFEGRQDC